jgi:lysozyme
LAEKVKTGQAGIDLMHSFEGKSLKPYLCPAHIWTIGYGHVLYQEQVNLPVLRKDGYTGILRKDYPLAAQDNRTWSQEDDLVRFERGVLRMSPNLAGRQSSFDAVVSFAFNAGVGNYQRSSIRMKNNRADYEGAAEAFMMWTIGGGKELPGLVRRRKAEKALYLRGA